jgi:Viral BACON domain
MASASAQDEEKTEMLLTWLNTAFTVKPRPAFGAVVGATLVAVPLLVAFSNLPPVSSSGAPGENTCADCHSGIGAATVSVAFPGGLTYTPGVTQRLRIAVAETGKLRWGFQLSARPASNPTAAQAGDLNPVDALTAVRCGDSSTRTAAGCPAGSPLQFAGQTSAGTQAGTANGAFWDVDWTPPASDVGNVRIFVAGLAANGDSNTGGDDTATANFTLTPAAPPASPTITVNPGSLSFAVVFGAGAPAAQTFHVTSSGSPLTFTTSFTTVNGGNWLQVTPPGGAAPMDVSVSVVPTDLQPGTYLGSVSVASAGASNSPQTVGVTLTVSPVQGPPVLTLTPPTLAFLLPAGGAAASQTAQLNSTTSGLAFSAVATTTDGALWLSATPASGTTPSALQVTANPAGLAAGTYTGTVSVAAAAAGNSPQSIAVSLTVTNSALTVSPATLTFNSPNGGPVPSQTLLVGSTGSALSIAATATTVSGVNWLSVTPNGTTPASLSVAVNPSGLATGTFTGAIMIASAGASNTPQAVAVTLVVGTAPPTPTITDLTYKFNVLDRQSGGADRMLLSGSGAISGGVLTGSGDFNRFTPTSSDRNVTVSTGTWTATGIVSFIPATNSGRGGNGDGGDFVSPLDHGEDHGGDQGNNNGGILVISVNLLPTGGSPIPATLRIANTGSDFGVTLTITGGDIFTPTETGNVTIAPANNGNDGGHDGGHDGGDALVRRRNNVR